MPDLDPQIPDDDLVALTMLADGQLAPEAATALRERLQSEPALAAEFDRQRRGRSIVRAAAEEVEAPLSLRERIEVDRARAPVAAKRRRWWLPAGAASLVGAAAAAIVLVFSAASAPSVTDVLDAATQTAAIGVSVDNATPQLLETSLDGVAFPNFAAKFGWDATGARTDEIDGRATTTVFYEKDGRSVAYTIVAGAALDVPDDGSTTTIEGRDFTSLKVDGRTLVTWERGGHTCVLSAAGASPAELTELAAWKGKGAVAF